MKKIRIGGGQGFWGDSNDAAVHMIHEGDLDYMACDYLAELTLSIMQRQKLKNPQAGYARDFIKLLGECGREAYEKKIKIISNAGGMNICGGVEAIAEQAKAQGLPKLLEEGMTFPNMDDAGDFNDIKDKIVNANVYYGRQPIMDCIAQGADVVLMVGHLLECGGQGAGGNFDYDWRSVPDMDNLGFPIAEITEDSLHITKAPNCGGLISEQSCKEQFLYEVHDPANYITPDVTVDISKATIKNAGDNRVEIANIHGKPAPEKLKLCIGYQAGYRVTTYLSFAWPDAYEKAKYAGEILMKKMKRKNMKYRDFRIDYLGLNALHLGCAEIDDDLLRKQNEVVLRMCFWCDDKKEAQKIIPEISPLQLNGPPGASFFGGRAHVQDVVALWPTLIDRSALDLQTHFLEV